MLRQMTILPGGIQSVAEEFSMHLESIRAVILTVFLGHQL